MLNEGNEVILGTRGYSMLPFIIGGRDSVRLRRCSCYAIGDVVLAEIAPNHYVLHRIVSIEGDNVTLSGDGNLNGTEHCSIINIVGSAEAIVSPHGHERRVATAKHWRRLPRQVRRIILGVLRRSIKLLRISVFVLPLIRCILQ